MSDRSPYPGESRDEYIARRNREDEEHMERERSNRKRASMEMGSTMGYEYESQERGSDGWSAWG